MNKSQDRHHIANETGEKLKRDDWDPYLVWQKRIKNPAAPTNATSEAGAPDQGSDTFAVWESLFRGRN